MEYPTPAAAAARRRPDPALQQAEETIDLAELFYLLTSRLWQIVLALILGGALGLGYTRMLVTPMYQATAKLYIVSASSNSLVSLTDLQIGSQLTSDYQQLITVRPLLEDVIADLGLELAPAQLREMISIENPNSTRILNLTVRSDDPQLAADIANELAHQAIIYLPRIMACEQPNVAESALAPSAPYSPSYPRNLVLGAAAAALLYCGGLVLFFLLDDTLTTPDQVERYYGVQPLAVLPENGRKSSALGKRRFGKRRNSR